MKAMRVNFIPTDYFLGMFIGFNAILTPVYASTVVPLIVLFFIIILISRNSVSTQSKTIVSLLGLHVLWIFLSAYVNNANIGVVLKDVSGPILLITIFLLRISRSFVKGLCTMLAVLFFIDFSFNVSILTFGFDLLGRDEIKRPDDYFPRLSGVYYHPFHSINIIS